MAKTASKPFSLSNSSQKSPFRAVLMYDVYGHPRYFKFKRKHQQYGQCFQTLFPFLMTMFETNICSCRYTRWESSNATMPERFCESSYRLLTVFNKVLNKRWSKPLIVRQCFIPGLILATYWLWYPHAVPFLRNKILYSPLKPSKPHAV